MKLSTPVAAAFAVIALILPAAASAEIDVTGKELRPSQESCTIDGVKITLDVDRSVVLTGDSVQATLVAYGDSPKPVTVEISVLHSENHAGEPAELTATRIAHRTVRLTPSPAGGPPVATTLKLGERLKTRGLIDEFKIFIAAPGTPFPDASVGDQERPGFSQVTQDGAAALVDVLGWSGNTLTMKIEATSPVTLDAPFTIAVRLTNTSGRNLPDELQVQLIADDALGPPLSGLEIVRIEDPAEPDLSPRPWSKRAERVARFRVTPHTDTRHLVLLAKALVHDPDRIGPRFVAGAIDAVAFDASPQARANGPVTRAVRSTGPSTR
ncbi:MAG TPA: hypothetical protein VH165_35295 [Kofleriaceae bacterium]|nr:hypothetical protein [Kofleriaceae bacterium]